MSPVSDKSAFGQHVDVVVIGGGNAALCAAITARRAGASVLLLEAAPKVYRGGNTRHTRNCRIAHDAPNEIMSGPYLEDEYWQDLLKVTGGNTDEALARFTIRESKGLWDWLRAQGVCFQPPLGGTLGLGRTNAFFLGGGRSMLNALYRTAERLGVVIKYDAEVVELKIEAGRFSSAAYTEEGGTSLVEASSLVAASGGFEANIDWLRTYWGARADNFVIRGTPYNRGAVLKMLLDADVLPVGDPTQCHAVAVDARAPQFDGGIITRLDCIIFGVVVDKHGRRFYDEGEDFWPKRYAIWGRLIANCDDQTAFVVFDSKAVGQFMPSLYRPLSGSTLAELAGKLGICSSVFQKTILRYNESIRPGTFDPAVLDDCRTEDLEPPKSHWALPIDTCPYFAYPLKPGITFTYLGTRVDDAARLLMNDGMPSANMFGAGEIMAGNVLGEGYLAGFGMTIGSVFGRVAGQGAATHVNR